MPLAPINIPPGVVKPATPLQVKGRYWDANLIRWRSGKLLPVGGWQRITSTPLASTPRTIFTFTSTSGNPIGMIGCDDKLFALEGAIYTDITPTAFVGPEAGDVGGYGAYDYGELLYGLDVASVSISTAVRTTNVVTITTAANHKFITGMSVLIAGVTDTSFNGTFTVTVTGATTFTYAQTATNASSTGGTAALPVADRRPESLAFIPSFSWTIDNWGGESLAVASSDGRLLHWQEGEGQATIVGIEPITSISRVSNVATVTTTWNHGFTNGDTVIIAGNSVGSLDGTYTITSVPSLTTFTYANSGTNATGTGGTASAPAAELPPTNNRGVIVTQERHAVLIGAGGNSRRVAWSSREDYTNWNFASTTNTAGYLDLDTSSKIIMCAAVREGTLIWTQDEAWLMRYIGLPYIYSIDRIGFGCGLIAPRAFATTAGRCVWMGKESFWLYDGGVVRPLRCDVGSSVFDNIDPDSGAIYTHGSENNIFPEVWFWYPSPGSDVPDQSVFYNYAEDWWSIGNTMTRTACAGAGVFAYPIAADENNDLYYQENGWTAAGVPIETGRYAETGALNIQSGNTLSHLKQAITDNGYSYDSTQIMVYASMTPQGTEYAYGPYSPRSDGYTDMRVTGRDFRLKIEATEDGPWSIGETRINFQGGGGR
jgi:hypothetical protein